MYKLGSISFISQGKELLVLFNVYAVYTSRNINLSRCKLHKRRMHCSGQLWTISEVNVLEKNWVRQFVSHIFNCAFFLLVVFNTKKLTAIYSASPRYMSLKVICIFDFSFSYLQQRHQVNQVMGSSIKSSLRERGLSNEVIS